MAAPPPLPRHDSQPPRLPDEIVEEILLRLPADDPACLLRASLVCKTWGCAVSSPGFRRRLHELHRTPPVLGFLHNWDNEKIPRFISTTASSFSPAAPDRRSWSVLDCRHGRALFWSKDSNELLVWEPITGAERHIPVPWPRWPPNATVICAADGCNHCDCHGGPSIWSTSSSSSRKTPTMTTFTMSPRRAYSALYSSETGAWGELTSMPRAFYADFTCSSSMLVGRSLLYFISDDCRILEYDLARHGLIVFDPPEPRHNYYDYYGCRFYLMLAEDRALGLCQVVTLAEDDGLGFRQAVAPYLKLWSWKARDGNNAQWILTRVIYLVNLLPNGALVNVAGSLVVYGLDEGANAIFVNTPAGIFLVELQSELVKKVWDRRAFSNLIPVVSFYTPVPKGTHQDSPRVPCYENVAPEGASTLKQYGCALLPKSHEVIDPSSDVSKNVEDARV